MHTKTLRPAIAMIELIFAIVIMGIVMMSAPMLVSTATQSSYVAMQQEGINEAASRVNMIMGYAWDENNTDYRYIPPILHTTSAIDALAVEINGTSGLATGRRIGIPSKSTRTYIISDANTSQLNASTLVSDEGVGNEDDIDDFIGNISLTLIGSATDIDYTEKTTININTAVAYIDDNVTGNYSLSTISYVPFSASPTSTSNIKSITVTLTSTDTVNADVLEKTIVLRAFSSNIGGYEFKERVF